MKNNECRRHISGCDNVKMLQFFIEMEWQKTTDQNLDGFNGTGWKWAAGGCTLIQ